MKFQCWHMTADGAFYSPTGEVIPLESVKVVIKTHKDGEKSASLYASNDTNNVHEIKVDHFKVKYLKPPYPDHNAIAQQNRIACAQWAPNTAGQPRTCQKPMISAQDLGSTFGKAKGSLDLFGTNPRGSFSDWESHTVFSDSQTCGLRATLDGDKQVLKEAQDLMIQRLGRLDPQTVGAIFTEARFQTMDQKQLRRLRDSGSQNPEEAALDEWTNTFLKRIQEIKSAPKCKKARAAKRMLSTCALVIRSDG